MINGAQFSSDGKYIVTATGWPTTIWDSATGKKVLSFPREARSHNAYFNSDGRYIVTAFDYTARIGDTKKGAMMDSLEEHNERVIDA